MLFNYTTELRNFFEYQPELNPNGNLSRKELIEIGRKKLFDFDYPIFDEDYRRSFETNFIRNFYMRQIGFETFGLFKFQLETWLLINMPYWNKVYESELLKYDPLTNTKIDVTHNKTKDKTQQDTKETEDKRIVSGQTESETNRVGSTTTGETSTVSGTTDGQQNETDNSSLTDDNFNRELTSDNPDSRLSITANDGEGVIEYASEIKENTVNNERTTESTKTNTTNESSEVESETNSSTNINDELKDSTSSNITQDDTKSESLTSATNDVEDYVEHRIGKIGTQSYAKMIQEYRSTLLRIERSIFEEMNDLFMLVY